MKITRSQLRRIIREYGGRPHDPTVPGDQRRSPTGDAPPGGAFDAKVEEIADEIGDRAAGGYEPSIDGSPEAYADHILDVYLQNPPPPLDQMEDLEYVLTKPMYREQVKNAVLEYIGMMTEGSVHEAAGPAEKEDLKTSIQAYMKSSIAQTTPDEDGNIPDKDVEAAMGDLSSDAKIAAEEYVDSDPDRLGISSLGEAKMKITKKQLRRIIKEEMHAVSLSKGRDLDYGTGEGKMTRSQLHHVAEYAVLLHDMIRDEDDLPEWVQSKVAVMASNIGKIKHYLEYKLLRMGEEA